MRCLSVKLLSQCLCGWIKVKLDVLVGRLIAGRAAEKGVAKIDHQKIGAPPLKKTIKGIKCRWMEGSYIITEICHQYPPEEASITNILMVQLNAF